MTVSSSSRLASRLRFLFVATVGAYAAINLVLAVLALTGSVLALPDEARSRFFPH